MVLIEIISMHDYDIHTPLLNLIQLLFNFSCKLILEVDEFV